MHGITLCLPSKILHTNLHTVSNNGVNRPHNYYVNAYYIQIMYLVVKLNAID